MTPAVDSPARADRTTSRNRWVAVLLLALPVLAQQYLLLSVTVSDRFLAGHFDQLDPGERLGVLSAELMPLGLAATPLHGSGLPAGLASVAPAFGAEDLKAKEATFQSAQTTAHYIAWVLSCYSVFVSAGSTALVARFVGAGDHDRAAHVANQSILLALGLGLVGTAAGFVGVDRLVLILQLKGTAATLAADYLRPLLALLVFQLLESAGIACLVGAGDTRTGLAVTAGVAVVNVPLAWAFFLGFGPFPRLGFVGISTGTAVSHVLGGTAVVVILALGRRGLRLSRRRLRPNVELLCRLLRVSVPAGLDSLSTVAGQLWFLSIINGLGDVASSAHGIALNWEALGYLTGAAFGTAAMALVGQRLGAGRPDLAAGDGWRAFGLGCLAMSLMGAVFYALAPAMFGLFCPRPEQRPIIAAGVPALRLVAFAMPILASTIIFTSALRGAGDSRVPVLFTWVGFLGVRIPLAYALTLNSIDLGPLGIWPGADMGLYGAWLAMFVDLVVRGGFFLGRFAGGAWQRVTV